MHSVPVGDASSANHINWESLTVVICTIITTVGGFAAWIIRTVNSNRQHTKQVVKESVQQVAAILDYRLNRIDGHLARQDNHLSTQDDKIDAVRDRVSRLEGRNGRKDR